MNKALVNEITTWNLKNPILDAEKFVEVGSFLKLTSVAKVPPGATNK